MIRPATREETLVPLGMILTRKAVGSTMTKTLLLTCSAAFARKLSLVVTQTAIMMIVLQMPLWTLARDGMTKIQKDAADGIRPHSKLLRPVVHVEVETLMILKMKNLQIALMI